MSRHYLVDLVKQLRDVDFTATGNYKFFILLRSEVKNLAGQILGQTIFDNLDPGNFQVPTSLEDKEIEEIAYDMAVLIVRVYRQASEDFGHQFAIKMMDSVKLTGN